MSVLKWWCRFDLGSRRSFAGLLVSKIMSAHSLDPWTESFSTVSSTGSNGGNVLSSVVVMRWYAMSTIYESLTRWPSCLSNTSARCWVPFAGRLTNRMWLCSVGPVCDPCGAPFRWISSGTWSCSWILAFSHPWPFTRGHSWMRFCSITRMDVRAASFAFLFSIGQ